MKLYHHIRGRNKPVFAQALRDLGVSYKSDRIPDVGKFKGCELFDVTIDDDDPHWPILRDLAVEHGIEIHHLAEYSGDDIASAPWLFAYTLGGAGNPQPERNAGYRAASFDLSHWCPRCGIGEVQNRPVRLKRGPGQRYQRFFAPGDLPQVLLARPDVRAVFEAETVTGVRYLETLEHKTNKPIENLIQILPTTTLQGGLIAAVQESEVCNPDVRQSTNLPSPVFCGRTKYHVPSTFRLVHYSRSVFDGSPDIMLSGEWFGSGGLAFQIVIISNRVARIILEHKWKGLQLLPLQVV